MKRLALQGWEVLSISTMMAALIGCGGGGGARSDGATSVGGAPGGDDGGTGGLGAGTDAGAGGAIADGGADGGQSSGCSDLFDPDVLGNYAIDISADEWTKMTAEFQNIQAVLAGTPQESYHPITFHSGNETVANAAIRLKGQSSWVDTVSFDVNPKMQFVVAFDRANASTTFHGVGKIEFDMPRSDWSFINERLANTWLRQIGILAPCANSGKLTINGVYYGLYVTEESKGSRLLNQFFPGNAQGDFFKGGSEADTNKSAPNWTRNQQFWDAKDITAVNAIVDLPNSLLEWASEAVLNDSDGYYGGSHNFYIYDQGASGYVFVPTDVDATLEWMSVFTTIGSKQHPIFWWENRPFPQPPGQHYLVVMNDPTWRARYVAAIATQLAKWNPAQVQKWIDDWSAQIAAAVAADPHKWATVDGFNMAVSAARGMATDRPAFLQSFVACEQGQPADDLDHDGVVWCNDCRDDDATVRPGITDVCGNHIDDNCNGVVDENCPGEAPGYPGQPLGTGGAGGAGGGPGTGGGGATAIGGIGGAGGGI